MDGWIFSQLLLAGKQKRVGMKKFEEQQAE